MKKPLFPTREDFIQAWIDFSKAEQGSDEYEESFWCFMLLSDLIEDFPNETLDIFVDIINQDSSPEVISSTSAGPLEDLISDHGALLIDKIVTIAENNKNFNHALGGVWKSTTKDAIWNRIENVRNEEW